MSKLVTGFRDFVLRGNVVELAVGIVIGAAFGAVVSALVEGILNPLIGAIFGQPNLDRIWTITINSSEILPGVFLTAVLNFLLIALAIYLLVVAPMNRLNEYRKAREKAEPAAPAAPPADVVLLSEIRDLLAQQGRAGGS